MYASGLASDEEVQRLEAAMQQSPEVQTAVEACLQDMESYVLLQAVPPPPDLRAMVLAADLDQPEVAAPAVNGSAYQNGHAAVTPAAPTAKVVRSNPWMYAAAAVFGLLIASGALNYVYINRYHQILREQQEQLVQVAKADNGMQIMQTKMTVMQQEMDLQQDANIQVIKLAGVPTHEGLSAMVYWNAKTNTVYFNGSRLPPPAAGKQYQLWAIVDGKPVDAGMFNSSEHTMQQMKAIANAQMFAITLENQGGSPSPTMEQMYVAGKVTV